MQMNQGGTLSDDVVELLLREGAVKAWRAGTDLHVTVPGDATEEEFRQVVAVLGLEGRTDYEVSYIPETGDEIYHVPVRSGLGLGGLSVKTATVAGLGIGVMGANGLLSLLLQAIGS